MYSFSCVAIQAHWIACVRACAISLGSFIQVEHILNCRITQVVYTSIEGSCRQADSKTRVWTMANVPLYEAKADLFRTLGHPVRIRVLELLQDGPRPVRELLADIGVEASNLSQQLAVLRRAGLVSSSRGGSTVVYTLATPDVANMLLYGRRILASMWTDQEVLLAELRESVDSV